MDRWREDGAREEWGGVGGRKRKERAEEGKGGDREGEGEKVGSRRARKGKIRGGEGGEVLWIYKNSF